MSMYKLHPPLPNSHHWIQQEFDQFHYDLHKSRLRRIQPSINSKPPKIHPHVEVNLKRLQLENDRLMKIENENQRLLKALVDTAERRRVLSVPNDYEPKSLNLNQRVNATFGLLRENEKLVNRLINVKPTHDRLRLDKEWTEREKIMHNISRYRHPWRRMKPQMDEDQESSSYLPVVRGAQIGNSVILLKQAGGRKSINHRRARSMDPQLIRRSLDKSKPISTPDRDETEDNGDREKE